MSINEEISKDERINKEIERLNNILKDVEVKKKDTLQGLIVESAFMRATLQDLRKDIDANGVIDEMPQGTYSIIRESPYVKTYNSMIQRYTTINDKIMALLPKEEIKEKEKEVDPFEEFLKGR